MPVPVPVAPKPKQQQKVKPKLKGKKQATSKEPELEGLAAGQQDDLMRQKAELELEVGCLHAEVYKLQQEQDEAL
ncbi:hypothetical protein FQN53_004569 [Emmonsiellopsis sp. PD_33]|nr:hypothetical protein FQN53_004569 [Emmonsiellopsis sp. PD_33]